MPDVPLPHRPRLLRYGVALWLLGITLPTFAAKPATYWQEIRPILIRNCVSCHQPDKLKGKLDLTTYAGLKKGGETGQAFIAGDPSKSLMVQQVIGDEPEMPAKGDPLRSDDVALISRWIKEGAIDDTPTGSATAIILPTTSTQPSTYALAPAITAVAWSPDGSLLAVAGNREILLHRADGTALVGRLPGGSPRITALIFSKDGSRLMGAGGAPGLYGLVELWNVADRKRLAGYVVSKDTLFGAAWSSAEDRIAVGCADKSARVLDAATGKELLRFDAHSDWVLGTAFSLDGVHLVTGGRDKNIRFTAIPATQPAESVNDPQEPITCIARHPSQDLIVAGSAQGALRVFKINNLQQPTDQKRDPNQVRSLERQPGAINAIAFSADSNSVAIASTGEVRVYATKDWNRIASLAGNGGPVFSLAFSPDGSKICTGGYDGQVRLFELKSQKQVTTFVPVSISAGFIR